jgi:hypothetical protein
MLKRLFIICNLSFIIFFLLPFPALAATLSLVPSKGSFNRGCDFSLKVNIDTQGADTDGSDVILLYNPGKFSATSIDNGSLYADFPGNNIDNNSGKVSIYALAPTNKGFSGKGVLATVNFTVTATASAGPATVNFDFDPKNPTITTDSNVIQRSSLQDVLTSVTNGSYTIGSSACGTQATESASLKGGVGGTADTLPNSGFTEPTLILTGFGLLMLFGGLWGLKGAKR